MKKSKRLLLTAAILLAAALFCIHYMRPMGIETRYPALDLYQCTKVSGYYYSYGAAGTDDTPFSLTPDDPRFAELLTHLQTSKFRTTLRNLLPDTPKVHRYSDGDFQWTLSLYFEDVQFPDGSIGRGSLLRIDNFYGDLELHFDGESTRCVSAQGDTWLRAVMDIITQYPE
ncbi:MAG: hypothetical protein IIY16_04895 [Oscillospiraceae bacterium]|nr:hypothetical protein [Oscillospiraceae bacterium]